MARHLADHDSRPVDVVDADGAYLIDAGGRRYLDFTAGWCVGNVGWRRPEVVEAVRAQAARGVYAPAFLRYPPQEEYAARLASLAPDPALQRVFRCASGSEAVEFAIKCARAATGRPTVVSVDGVYHGHTYAAASLGDACVPAMAPCAPGFLKIPMPHPRYGSSPAESLARFEAILGERDDVAAFITEPVFTNAGAIVPPPGFLPEIERLCRERGILFMMDEVATGFGRCGRLFGSELWGLHPDAVCLGKGITGGYGAMGATMVTERLFEASRGLPTYSTFGWVPNDLAAAAASLDVIVRGKLWENAERVGARLREGCAAFTDLPFVAEVRGIGMVLGIEIVHPHGGAPDYRRAREIQDRCAGEGLVIETAGNALFVTPPLTLTEAQADEGLAVLRSVLSTL